MRVTNCSVEALFSNGPVYWQGLQARNEGRNLAVKSCKRPTSFPVQSQELADIKRTLNVEWGGCNIRLEEFLNICTRFYYVRLYAQSR